MLNLKELAPAQLQARWTEITVSGQEVTEWKKLNQNFDQQNIKFWKFYGFTPATAASWIGWGLFSNDYQFAYYYTAHRMIPREWVLWFEWQEAGISAQDWLDLFYPVSGSIDVNWRINNLGQQRQEISQIAIDRCYLTDYLDLTYFTELEELNCADNRLTYLQLPVVNKLREIAIDGNNLDEFPFHNLNPATLIILNISNNNLTPTDLGVFSQLVNLERLLIGNYDSEKITQEIYNRFYGSLIHLQHCLELRWLEIANTNINTGLEYLPANLRYFAYSADLRPTAQVQAIAAVLNQFPGADDFEKYRHWRRLQDHAWLTSNAQRITELKKIENNLRAAISQTQAPNELLANALFNQNNGFQLWLSSEIISLEKENREYHEFQEINYH